MKYCIYPILLIIYFLWSVHAFNINFYGNAWIALVLGAIGNVSLIILFINQLSKIKL